MNGRKSSYFSDTVGKQIKVDPLRPSTMPSESRKKNLRGLRVSLFLIVLMCFLWMPSQITADATDVPIVEEEAVPSDETLATEERSPEGEPIDNTHNDKPVQEGVKTKHHGGLDEGHCAWGTACHPDYDENAGHQHQAHDEAKKGTGNASHNTGNIPFVHHHHSNTHGGNIVPPPEGFTIVARVYTDPSDKLAHFTDDEQGSQITLPYWECGATGSTTSPLPVKHAYFRHALSGSKPQVWSGTEYGPHPQLVVALKRMEMTLNSGETKILKAGDVVLLEDVVSGGHKLKALEGFDMTYLLLTLPQHYHHVGRDQMALKRSSTEKRESPCANEQQPPPVGSGGTAFVNRQAIPKQESLSSKTWEKILTGGNVPEGQVAPFREPKLRKLILGAIGVSFSALVADFLGKVAPLWLAVGIGGTCFVIGGTAAVVQGGDYLCTELEMWHERKRLEVPSIDDEEIIENMEKSMPKTAAAAP